MSPGLTPHFPHFSNMSSYFEKITMFSHHGHMRLTAEVLSQHTCVAFIQWSGNLVSDSLCFTAIKKDVFPCSLEKFQLHVLYQIWAPDVVELITSVPYQGLSCLNGYLCTLHPWAQIFESFSLLPKTSILASNLYLWLVECHELWFSLHSNEIQPHKNCSWATCRPAGRRLPTPVLQVQEIKILTRPTADFE